MLSSCFFGPEWRGQSWILVSSIQGWRATNKTACISMAVLLLCSVGHRGSQSFVSFVHPEPYGAHCVGLARQQRAHHRKRRDKVLFVFVLRSHGLWFFVLAPARVLELFAFPLGATFHLCPRRLSKVSLLPAKKWQLPAMTMCVILLPLPLGPSRLVPSLKLKSLIPLGPIFCFEHFE